LKARTLVQIPSDDVPLVRKFLLVLLYAQRFFLLFLKGQCLFFLD